MEAPMLLRLDRVLRLVSEEVAALAGLATAAGAALAIALDGAKGPLPPCLLHDAQGLDELGQRIAGLRAYLDELASAAPRTALLDVSAGVAALTLGAQARRLSDRAALAAGAGAVELF